MEEKIRAAWSQYPNAVVKIMEVKNKTQVPKWQECRKNELFIAIMRKGSKDVVTVVRHKMAGEYELNVHIEQLTDEELNFIGAYPSSNHYCKECGEFSTRIDINGKCRDCNDKNKIKAK